MIHGCIFGIFHSPPVYFGGEDLCIKKMSSKCMCQHNWIYQYPPNFDEHFAQELVPVWEWTQQIIQCFCFLNLIFLFWTIGKCQNHADILRWHWSWVSQSRGKFKTKSVRGGRRGNTLLLIKNISLQCRQMLICAPCIL